MAGEIAAEWIKIPDGNGGFNKVWVRDSAARRSIAQLQTEIADISAADIGAIPSSQKGAASGVAELDANGLVPSSQLPSYVDDVLEYASSSSFPATGETGKIYVDLGTNLTYRWSGSAYVEISPSLALGTTSSTAYRGDRGSAAYEHAVTNKGSAYASGLYKITTNSEGHVTGATAVAKSDITSLGIPGSVPSKTSDLTNDSGFITSSDVPTAVSELTNDSDFQSGAQVSSAISAEAGLMIPYGYCTIAAATAAKTVTVSPDVTSLETGLTIAVKFQYANTAQNPTLDVNGLGAKAIKRYGTTAAGTSAAANWNTNSVVLLTYDGTYWMLADWNNTTYSGMTDAEYQAGTSTSNQLITPARLKAAIELHAPVQSVNGNTGAVTISVPTKTSDLTNDSGFLTSAPVASVNGQTGAVSLTASDVGALPSSTPIPSKTSDLTNDSGFITASAVPDPSSAAPAMDGTAAAGSSDDYARADHVHPSDTSKQDALTTAQLNAVNSGITADFVSTKFAVVAGTMPTTAGQWSAYISMPSGFTADNSAVIGISVSLNNQWRWGEGAFVNSFGRAFYAQDNAGIRVSTSFSNILGHDVRIVLMRIDI